MALLPGFFFFALPPTVNFISMHPFKMLSIVVVPILLEEVNIVREPMFEILTHLSKVVAAFQKHC